MSDSVFWPGIGAMAALYLAVFLIGVAATRCAPRQSKGSLTELMLAGRALPAWVALLTMTATWVGGGYINGTAETTFTSGVLWGAQPGVGYALSLILGGLVFARTMRRHGFATLIDPLEIRYGRHLAAVLMVPAVLAELFWSAAILVALGTTFGTVIGVDLTSSILLSAGVAIAYTVFGGLRAVAFTDVAQLGLIVIGLGLALLFVVEAAGGLPALATSASGVRLSGATETASYADWTFLLILGGIPWNVYFQRVLSSRDEHAAAKTSMIAGVLCALMAVPPLLLGLAATQLDWDALAPGSAATLAETPALVLPYVLRYAVPTWVAVLGLGAVSAAVMSSVDSSILSASSLVAWNGYRRLVDPSASDARVAKLVRILVILLGAAATLIALSIGSVSALWYLCGDVVYCVLFPQLSLALFDKKANRAGAACGLVVSAFLRLGGGDVTLGLPAFLPYPDWGEVGFPFRSLAMLVGVFTALAVARLTQRVDPPQPLGRRATYHPTP